MALGDIVQTPQFAETPDLNRLNREVRRIFARLNSIEGRTESAQVRDDLEVLGDVTTQGIVSTGVDVGAGALVAAAAGTDPDIPADLAPMLTSRPDSLGFSLPLEAGSSPFYTTAYDAFLGTGTGSGAIGNLGWTFSTAGGGSLSLNEGNPGHPGVYGISTGAVMNSPASIVLQEIDPADVKYLAAVVGTGTFARQYARFGLISTPALGSADSDQGIYFSGFAPGAAGTGVWRTVTQSASGSTTSTSTVSILSNSWYLLEIVLAADTADFYVNRQRLFRHTTNIPTIVLAPAFAAEAIIAADRTLLVDTFVLGGITPAKQLWT